MTMIHPTDKSSIAMPDRTADAVNGWCTTLQHPSERETVIKIRC